MVNSELTIEEARTVCLEQQVKIKRLEAELTSATKVIDDIKKVFAEELKARKLGRSYTGDTPW